MKVNRDRVAEAGLALLNEVGLEQLTLRLLGERLGVRAATLYWHFGSKQELIDELATRVLAGGADRLVPSQESADWRVWATTFGVGLRATLLAYRDGARLVAGSRLTDTRYMQSAERLAARLAESGFSVREAVVLLATVYTYTLSFVLEEQAVFPRPGERSPLYDLAERNARLDPALLPLMTEAGAILFDDFDRRYQEGLDLIVRGAEASRALGPAPRPDR